jgi:DNA-binding transcriptional LysR family regulator
MKRDELGDLSAFLAVVEEGNFTRAAARMATSQSALSHTVRRLETRLGVRLLNRTTRRVAPTEAGEKLAATLRPCFDEIGAQLSALNALRDRPAGLVRITSSTHAAESILWPALSRLLPDYPDIQAEISLESRLTDIVTERFDAGVRLGESLDKDMVAVPIGPDLRMALVGSPGYFAARGVPAHPQDLMQHACINLRLQTLGGLYAWEFEKQGRALNVRVEGPLIFNAPQLCLIAAREGHGLAFLPEDQVRPALAAGQLQRALADWCPAFPGYHLYYPSRRQLSPALRVVVEALRYRTPPSGG